MSDKNSKLTAIKEHDPVLYEAIMDASTLIESGYPSLVDHRLSWNNKASEICENLMQFRSNYQYIADEITVRTKSLEYKEFMNSIESDQYKSWNEKSLLFYGNNMIVDYYRRNNYNKFVITVISEYINIIKYMSR